MPGDRDQAVKWRGLAYAQLGVAALLGAFAGLAMAGLVGVPNEGGLAPLLVAVVFLGLVVRSLHKARGLS